VAKPGYSDVTCSAGSSTVPASCMNGFPHPTGPCSPPSHWETGGRELCPIRP
jgi:hypothetical protein